MPLSYHVCLLVALLSFCFTAGDKVFAQPESASKAVNKVSKNTIQPTEEQKRWAAKGPEYSRTCKDIVLLLRKGKLDTVLREPSFNLENVEDQTNYLEEVLIPYFSNFHESGKVEFDSAHKTNGKYDGFSIYRSFTTKKGSKKFYLVRVLERDGKPSITEIIVNRKYEDDYPESARRFKKSHPQVEEIRPTAEPGKMWEASKKATVKEEAKPGRIWEAPKKNEAPKVLPNPIWEAPKKD